MEEVNKMAEAKIPTINLASRTKLTVKHMQDMKGKEPISMICTNEPWIAAAEEMAGAHIIRSYSWGENEEERIRNTIPTITITMGTVNIFSHITSKWKNC